LDDYQHKQVLLLGVFGAFGRHLANRLAKLPGIELTLGVPDPSGLETFARESGAKLLRVDPADASSLARAVEGRFIVVNTCGPFHGQDYAVAEAAMAAGAHYIDPADEREYVSGFEALQRRAQTNGCLLVTGASVSPALSAALIEMAAADFNRVTEIETFLAPGSRDRRELATARTVLDYLDHSIRIKERGRWRQAPGWLRPRVVHFPQPIGRRRGYLCDTADLDLFPRHFGAHTVLARAGIRARIFNNGVTLLAMLRRRRMIDRVPRWAQNHLRRTVRLVAPQPGAGLRVELRGTVDGGEQIHVLYLITRRDNGHALAAAPIQALVRKWVEHGVSANGAVACIGLLTWEELRTELLGDDDVALIRAWEAPTAP
jgi:saccharopine dehydrogenase-like NADP-dependent oxidoreductase